MRPGQRTQDNVGDEHRLTRVQGGGSDHGCAAENQKK